MIPSERKGQSTLAGGSRELMEELELSLGDSDSVPFCCAFCPQGVGNESLSYLAPYLSLHPHPQRLLSDTPCSRRIELRSGESRVIHAVCPSAMW